MKTPPTFEEYIARRKPSNSICGFAAQSLQKRPNGEPIRSHLQLRDVLVIRGVLLYYADGKTTNSHTLWGQYLAVKAYAGLIDFTSPSLCAAKREFNETMDKLAKLDPSTPDERIEIR